MTITKRIIPGLLLATALTLGSFAVPQPAQAVNYDDYDYDENAYWSEEEWRDYSYDAIDYNGDGLIDQAEWEDYTTTWYAPFGRENNYRLTYYDTNRDGFLDEREYAMAYDPNLFYSWDLDDDGWLDDQEYNTAFNTYEAFDREGLFDW